MISLNEASVNDHNDACENERIGRCFRKNT